MATHAYLKQAGKKYRYRRFAHPVVQPDGSADMGFNDGPDHSKPQDAQKGAANDCIGGIEHPKRLTENELSDFSRLWHDGCVKTIIEAQDVDRNHSA
jgi:hypothetical protein